MSLTWTDWTEIPAGTAQPYIDWWKSCPPAEFRKEDVGPEHSKDRGYLYFTLANAAFRSPTPEWSHLLSTPSIAKDDDAAVAKAYAKLDADFGSMKVGQGPLPDYASNGKFDNAYAGTVPAGAMPEAMNADTVIVGVIDTGISLGATRLRDKDGKSRILAAWLQDAAHDDRQDYLPFGRELYKSDIDRMIGNFTTGDEGSRAFHEHAFNVEAGIVNMHEQLGSRELAGRASHGAFVADLAAGDDPANAHPLIKIIAVNLPNRATINNSGIFLDYFTLHAVQRIAQLADACWQNSEAAKTENGSLKGFPIVINLSFGKNAGSKDGEDYFCRELRAFNEKRKYAKYRPVQVVIPVGNHNLAQGNASFDLAPGEQDEIGFRVLPEDQSSNYLEIWSEVIQNPEKLPEDQVLYPFAISVTPPSGGTMAPEPGSHFRMRTLAAAPSMLPVARLYSGVRMAKDFKSYRVWYLLCTAPSIARGGKGQECLSGRWNVKVTNVLDQQRRCYLHVQTDQSIRPQSATGLLSRLESEKYERWTDDGRVRDSYPYPYTFGDKNLETSPILQRHGSINSTAAAGDVIAVAGHRRSDGRPAEYSATGWRSDATPVARGSHERGSPTASFVTDDGYAHFGILAAGAADGSMVALRGTSFAAAQATRLISARLTDKNARDENIGGWLVEQASYSDQQFGFSGDKPPSTKIGAGRMLPVELGKVDRLGNA